MKSIFCILRMSYSKRLVACNLSFYNFDRSRGCTGKHMRKF